MDQKSTVLIVEDDFMIADMTEEMLVQNGYIVCGIARTVSEAVALGKKHRPDIALVDFRLADGGLGPDVAAQLTAVQPIGILYVTGNNTQVGMHGARGEACLVKPYRFTDLLRGLEIVAGMASGGVATPPFPRGFQLLRPEGPPQAGPSM
ncbi:MAG: response regulator [Alphaproteobacteria bacterium]